MGQLGVCLGPKHLQLRRTDHSFVEQVAAKLVNGGVLTQLLQVTAARKWSMSSRSA